MGRGRVCFEQGRKREPFIRGATRLPRVRGSHPVCFESCLSIYGGYFYGESRTGAEGDQIEIKSREGFSQNTPSKAFLTPIYGGCHLPQNDSPPFCPNAAEKAQKQRPARSCQTCGKLSTTRWSFQARSSLEAELSQLAPHPGKRTHFLPERRDPAQPGEPIPVQASRGLDVTASTPV